MSFQVNRCSGLHLCSPEKGQVVSFLNRIKSNTTILIVGIGDGKVAHDINQEGNRVIGVDWDKQRLNFVRHWLTTFTFKDLQPNQMEKEFDKHQFGGVWLGEYFGERQKEIMTSIKPLLEPNGYLSLVFPPAQEEAMLALIKEEGYSVLSQEKGKEIRVICQKD
jgi:2-polyprenyl-3-methyl-5-hydroxy-6-metoxy-1,4-benzoquinol methylase